MSFCGYKTETKKEITLQRFEASMGDFLDGLLYTNQDYCYYGPTELCQAILGLFPSFQLSIL